MLKNSRSEMLMIRGVRYHVRHWGNNEAPILFMLHGWMDVSASFQFVVDSLKNDWHVIAPDWRGFGLSVPPKTDCFWFPDYLADLDALLTHYSPNTAIHLLGHSMGANVAAMYAGIRPERITSLINLEGFGLPTTHPKQAPKRFAKWLNELRETPTMRSYAGVNEVALRLQKNNPRLTDEKATFLAAHWSAQNADGRWEILGDPAHKLTGATLFQVDEMLACWSKITAPVLWCEAIDTNIWSWMGEKDQARPEIDRRLGFIPRLQKEMILEAGHMLHHDQPDLLAHLIEDFLSAPRC